MWARISTVLNHQELIAAHTFATPPQKAQRVGIISCIHGNLEALQAVLADLQAREIESVVCLGDLVGYGPFPG